MSPQAIFVDRVPISASFELREGSVQVILPIKTIVWGLVYRSFGLGAQVRGSSTQPWSPLMKRPEFLDISPHIHFDPGKNPPGVDGLLCVGSDPRIIMDIMRIYRQSPEFPKAGFVIPAVLRDSPTLVQRVHMSRLHDSLYCFYICDALTSPQSDLFMQLCVINLRQPSTHGDGEGRGTRTTFRLEGAAVPEESRELLTFDLPPGHFDVRKIRLVAPNKVGRHLLAINCESRMLELAKGAAIFGAAFVTEAALGNIAGSAVHVAGALLAQPMKLNASFEVMDEAKSRLVSERRAQILVAVSRSLEAKEGIQTRYGDVVPKEGMLQSFERFVSLQRLDNITEKDWNANPDRAKELFISFAQREYGIQVALE
jgi:hypothetical protein